MSAMIAQLIMGRDSRHLSLFAYNRKCRKNAQPQPLKQHHRRSIGSVSRSARSNAFTDIRRKAPSLSPVSEKKKKSICTYFFSFCFSSIFIRPRDLLYTCVRKCSFAFSTFLFIRKRRDERDYWKDNDKHNRARLLTRLRVSRDSGVAFLSFIFSLVPIATRT